MKLNPGITNLLPYRLPVHTAFTSKLDMIENQHPPSHGVVTAIAQHACNPARYPIDGDRRAQLVSAILAYINVSDSHLPLSAGNVILTNGSDNALRIICTTVGHPHSSVLI